MVKILSIFITTLAAISPMVQAGCTPGLNYCGWNLRQYGGKEALGSQLSRLRWAHARCDGRYDVLLRYGRGSPITPTYPDLRHSALQGLK
ncbi:hypothetical protein E4U60_003121 [Claviceps pazoutovae]|uniref:Peptidase inhibitor family I36 n=1 Tax=Claviceps pazoutovae TaxID=1649127 RepID=A0A9P7SFQ6_9HYPO|nr:hypothetical protein E4U60_003121 [Claviceps pazoutovae]